MKLTLYKITLYFLLRMPNWLFAVLFRIALPIYKVLHQKKAYGRTVSHLQNAVSFTNSTIVERSAYNPANLRNCSADDVFKGIYWNAIDSYRGLMRRPCVTDRIVFENEEVLQHAMSSSRTADGNPSPIAAISIHQGPFELLHRSLCQFSDNVHLITDSVGDNATRLLLKNLRSDPHLTEYHPDELSQLLRNLFTRPSKIGKKRNAILAMVIDQGRHTKGKKVTLFGQPSTLYLRLPEMVNQMGAGIVTFRTFTRPAQNKSRYKTEIVIRFETFYPAKFNEQNSHNSFYKECGTTLADCIAKEIENWISEHPSEWSWNYHGNFRA